MSVRVVRARSGHGMKLRRLADGVEREGPEGPVPEGFERVADTRDIIGRVKGSLLPEPTKGSFRDNPFAAGIRALVPGSIPSAAGTGAALIPGAGLPMTLGRAALATGATAGAEKLAGRDVGLPSAKAAIESLVGSTVGGLGRVGYRLGKAALDKTAPAVVGVIEKLVPEFAGKTWQTTVQRLTGGEGMREVSDVYGTRLKALYEMHGDPFVTLPSLTAVSGARSGRGLASQLEKEIDSLSRSLFKEAGDPSRRASALTDLDALGRAKDELAAALRASWPAWGVAARGQLDTKYRAAKELARWFEGAPYKDLVSSQGRVNVPLLQELFATRRDDLKRAVGDQGFQAILTALRQPTGELARDVPGRGLLQSVGGHFGPGGVMGYLRHLPGPPVLAGEGLTPEMVARALRALGAGGTGAAAEAIK